MSDESISLEGPIVKAFIDESGTVQHGDINIEKCDYFIIAILMTDCTKRLERVFVKSRLKALRGRQDLLQQLKNTKEVKGSQVSETRKQQIYQSIITKCAENSEIGIIRLDNCKSNMRLRSNCSRTFNYMIKLYLLNFFKTYSKYKNPSKIDFLIDERNVATKSLYTLEDYLNTELNIIRPISKEDFSVKYADSRTSNLLQLTDFIANTYYRCYQKHDRLAAENVKSLSPLLCRRQLFKFPL